MTNAKNILNSTAAREWAAKRPGHFDAFKIWFQYFLFRTVPRLLEAETTWPSLLRNLLSIMASGYILLMPIYLRHENTNDELHQIFLMVMPFAFLAQWILGRLFNSSVKKKRESAQAKKLSAVHATLIRRMKGNVKHDFDDATRSQLISMALECIVWKTRAALDIPGDKANDTFVQSSLMIPVSQNGKLYLKILARDSHHREAGAMALAQDTLAYYVAREGLSKALPDIDALKFVSKKGLTEDRRDYRSVFFHPIKTRRNDGSHFVKAVVTIDSERKYDFWYKLEELVGRDIAAFVDLIEILIEDNEHVIEGEDNGVA